MSDDVKPPPGWYTDPHMAGTRRDWDGSGWTVHIAPMDQAPPKPASLRQAQPDQQPKILVAVILGAAIIGLVMSLQSASLISGSGTQWTGTAIAVAAAVGGIVMRRSLPPWLVILAVIVAVVALLSVIYLEVQLDQKRRELEDLLR